jgi:hypothetical protein
MIRALRNVHIRQHLRDESASQVSRVLRRLRCHGLIKKVGHTYKYYVTAAGRSVMTTGLKLKTFVLRVGPRDGRVNACRSLAAARPESIT